jgi:hypothetical protein
VREHRKQIAALVGLAPYDFQESRSTGPWLTIAPARPTDTRALRRRGAR